MLHQVLTPVTNANNTEALADTNMMRSPKRIQPMTMSNKKTCFLLHCRADEWVTKEIR
jgi:hypothetical protein